MNLNALILFIVSLGGLLAITIFFYGGQMLLHWLETPDPPQALAGLRRQKAPGFIDADSADMIMAIDRFDDDGGNQILNKKRQAEKSAAAAAESAHKHNLHHWVN